MVACFWMKDSSAGALPLPACRHGVSPVRVVLEAAFEAPNCSSIVEPIVRWALQRPGIAISQDHGQSKLRLRDFLKALETTTAIKRHKIS